VVAMNEDLAGASGPAATESPPRRPRRRRGRPSRARGQPNSSDEAIARWTVRGVPPPVRDMALRAAAARGMTVGDWVAEAIVALARGPDKRIAEGPKLPAVESPPELAQVLRGLDERLARLEQRHQAGFFRRLFGRRS
jgi:hypothetical protein